MIQNKEILDKMLAICTNEISHANQMLIMDVPEWIESIAMRAANDGFGCIPFMYKGNEWRVFIKAIFPYEEQGSPEYRPQTILLDVLAIIVFDKMTQSVLQISYDFGETLHVIKSNNVRITREEKI